MARGMTAAPRNAPWVHTSSAKPLAWALHRFDTVPHLSSHACRSPPSDASGIAFPPKVIPQTTDTDQPSVRQFLAPLAESVARTQPVPVVFGWKTARYLDSEFHLRF